MSERDPDNDAIDGAPDGEPGVAGYASRREASARFVVDSAQSSQAELRQALDPANQSLAEALRLSYRVLQLGILTLVVIFLFSGFQSVKEGFTGVKTIFGSIAGTPGDQQLSPGLQPFWPSPIGELVVFEQKRTIRLDKAFQPRERPNQATKEQQIDNAIDNRELIAERDGFVLTGDGDIAHLALTAEYIVEDAVEFLKNFDPAGGERVVRVALMRGVVLAGGQLTLREVIDQREATAALIKERSQEILDAMNTGIALSAVTVVDTAPPRFVDSKFREVQVRREDAKATVERARQEIAATLTATVGGGEAFQQLIGLIQDYDASLVRGDVATADTLLQSIGTRFEQPDIGGEVARIVQRAKASRSTLEAQLTKELRRLEGFAPAFRDSPRQLTRQLWLETVRTVMGGPEVEVISTPLALGHFDLSMASSQQVMQARRTADINRRRAAAQERNLLYADFQIGSEQINIDRAGVRLNREATGGQGRRPEDGSGPN